MARASFLPRIENGVNSSRNPEKHWIPDQVRNDKLDKTYAVIYKRGMGHEVGSMR
jgi:hypothetical protein